jgi:hypothetical protein
MPSTRIQTPNNKTVNKQFSALKSKTKPKQPSFRRPPLPKTTKKQKTNKLIRFMAKLQRGLFLRPNSRYSMPKSSNKK